MLTWRLASLPGPAPLVTAQSKLLAQPGALCAGVGGPSPAHGSSVPARLPFTIFQGGMPRASYGDRHCISVVHDGQQTAFDFTSRVIDFTVLTEVDPAAGRRLREWVWRASLGEVWGGGPPLPESGSPTAPLPPLACGFILAGQASRPPRALFALAWL